MLPRFLRAIGLLSKEYHHIVANFHTAIDELKALETRKINEAESLAIRIEADSRAKLLAEKERLQASNTAKNIAALLGTKA